jgi:hypothetical protein
MIYAGATTTFPLAIRDEDAALVDPASLTVTATSRAGRTWTFTYGTDAEVTRLETGRYRFVWAPPMPEKYVLTATVILDGNVGIDPLAFEARAPAG